MKIGGNITGFTISAQGLSLQRRKMNLIAENIANVDSVRGEDGKPYQRKYLNVVHQEKNKYSYPQINTIKLVSSRTDHIVNPAKIFQMKNQMPGFISDEVVDTKQGEMIYMPENPSANKDGYVVMSNVNIITEMTDMIAASRSYEANLTALNASKQIAKDSLEI